METCTEPTQMERLTVYHVESDEVQESFADDVLRGLGAESKSLLPKYFYDDLGSILFEAICVLPEYYPTRTESAILQRHAGAIVRWFDAPLRLVELGSGSGIKTRHLIEAAASRQDEVHYLPIDISAESIARSSNQLLQGYPTLNIIGYVADYTRGLRAIFEEGDPQRTLAIFLGSTIGNLAPTESIEMLSDLRQSLRCGDGLLLGADLKKKADILVAAYDDSLGVTAAFNLNLLARINREFGGDFDLRAFRHEARYNEEEGRIELHLVSTRQQTVYLAELNASFDFAAGERIHTENSYKFDRLQLQTIAAAAGFSLVETWTDDAELFSVNLLLAV